MQQDVPEFTLWVGGHPNCCQAVSHSMLMQSEHDAALVEAAIRSHIPQISRLINVIYGFVGKKTRTLWANR